VVPIRRFLQCLGTRRNWWLGSREFHDAAGHVLKNSTKVSVGEQAACFVQYYQPGDRFWTFQSIESAILIALRLAALGFAYYWVTRRVA